MFELVQKWFLFSEACPALLLRWTLATLMAQEVSEVPRTLPPGTSKPSLPPDSDCLSSFEIPYYPQCFTQQENRDHICALHFLFQVVVMKTENTNQSRESLRKTQSEEYHQA